MAEQLQFAGFVTGSVIIDGALETEETWTYGEGKHLDDWLRKQKHDAMSRHGQRTQIFLLHHDHSPDMDCECIQFTSDHRPFWEWPLYAPGVEYGPDY